MCIVCCLLNKNTVELNGFLNVLQLITNDKFCENEPLNLFITRPNLFFTLFLCQTVYDFNSVLNIVIFV